MIIKATKKNGSVDVTFNYNEILKSRVVKNVKNESVKTGKKVERETKRLVKDTCKLFKKLF